MLVAQFADLATDDPTAALGAVGAFGELGQDTTKGGTLYVFALDEALATASR